jgi:hypothetical protein
MKTLSPLMFALPLALAACGGTAAPPSSLASTQAAIRSAREVGAEQNPVAALHLQYAREGFAQAEQLSRDGEGERAQRVLQRAQADAELAMALSRRAAARDAATQASAQTPTAPRP